MRVQAGIDDHQIQLFLRAERPQPVRQRHAVAQVEHLRQHASAARLAERRQLRQAKRIASLQDEGPARFGIDRRPGRRQYRRWRR
jgi:hypothetical protein